MSGQMKREREWRGGGGPDASYDGEGEAKRPRVDAPASEAAIGGGPSFGGGASTSLAVKQERPTHPMAVLGGIRAKLLAAGDPHLQARLLLQYSTHAASPGAKTDAAIDFLFSFLQQNQAQSQSPDPQTAGEGGSKADASGSSGAIVVGAIVRGLRQLLAVKAAVVEPMIQVDAMGEQLMQCMSVGEDFKLRRDMMRIVVDCLMLTRKFPQVEALLRTCVKDHDAGMQAICLRGYLRLHDAGRCFVSASTSDSSSPGVALDAPTDHFDRLVAFLLFSESSEVRGLAARVLVALAELHPQLETPRSSFFPSSTSSTPLLEKIFCVLCMAGNDASVAVRAEVARCLRGFLRAPRREVVEHAVVKTQVSEVVSEAASEDVEANTRLMMSSGMLLSLLEDTNAGVAAEASRTIARLCELAAASSDKGCCWSQRALERAITAHLDVLPRARTPQSSAPELWSVLVNSVERLLVCRRGLGTKTDFVMADPDMGCLIRGALARSKETDDKSRVVSTLAVLLHCELSSSTAVQRVVNFVLAAAALPMFSLQSGEVDKAEKRDCWDLRLLAGVEALGGKCAAALQMDVELAERVRVGQATLRTGERGLLQVVCETLLGSTAKTRDGSKVSTKFKLAVSGGPKLFSVTAQPTPEARRSAQSNGSSSSVPESQAVTSMKTLQSPPAQGDAMVYLKAIHRLRSSFSSENLPLCYNFAEILVRLRQHVQSFPDASPAPPAAPTAHSYVSMDAMLSSSPSASTSHKNGTNDQTKTKASHAFARLRLSAELQTSCQNLVTHTSDMYVKTFALSSPVRAELLQLVLLGRMGLVLASLQGSKDDNSTAATIRWLSTQASQLRFLNVDSPLHGRIWFPSQLLDDVHSLDELKRSFVAVIRNAWPCALAEMAAARAMPSSVSEKLRRRPLATASAVISEPASSPKSEPREMTANWPFDQRVRFSLSHVRDVTQLYIKCLLPNGDATYHHVPVSSIRARGPRQYLVDHQISLTVTPISDPTAFTVAVCLRHPALPGCSQMPISDPISTQQSSMYTEISSSVRVRIYHRTTSTLRYAAGRV